MEYDEFECKLGNVAVSTEHVEREKSNSDKWKKIREEFDKKELVNNVHYADISYFEFRHGDKFPNIKIKTEDGLKRLYFLDDDTAEDCFESLKYRFHVFKQNYE